jgi:hypothetical protein
VITVGHGHDHGHDHDVQPHAVGFTVRVGADAIRG